jgi:hypothetical protein
MMNLDLLFNIANIFVLPFWLLMIFLPKWNITQKVIKSYLIFIPLALLYIYLFVISFNSESAQVLANPQLPELAQVFSDEKITFTGWVHFLVLDLFLGRYIYQQGQEKGIWIIHSLILSLFAGPIGLLSHIITDKIHGNLSIKKNLEIAEN